MKPGKQTFFKACFTACLSLAVLLGIYSVLTFSVTSGESSPSARISPSASERGAAEAPPPALELNFQRASFYVDDPAPQEESMWRAQWPDRAFGRYKRLRYRYNYDYGFSPIEMFPEIHSECPILYGATFPKPPVFVWDSNLRAAKPVLYLYPETETDVTVRLEYKDRLTCTYRAEIGRASCRERV